MIDRALLEAPATEVAPRLLGALLSVDGVTVRLTEVEAYLGELDPGSHAFRGPGLRNAVMYGPPGHLYTYFTYGMHVCANVVCSPDGVASAVLLRAGEVVEGLDRARSRRPTSRARHRPGARPGAPVRGARHKARRRRSGPRRAAYPARPAGAGSGLRDAGRAPGSRVRVESDAYPWRFWMPGEPTVSPYRPAVPRSRRR